MMAHLNLENTELHLEPETGRSRRDKAIATKRVAQIRLSEELLKGLLGIHDAGEVLAITQEEVDRQMGQFRVFVYSSRLPEVPDDQAAPFIELVAVQ